MAPPQGHGDFSEYCHVAYQIKGNEAYNNMLANILPLYTHYDPLVGVKRSFLFISESNHVHIKLMGMKHRKPRKQNILSIYTHLIHVWGQNVKSIAFLTRSCYILSNYKERNLEHNAS